LQQLQQGGLGGQVASWLGNGANHAISADQLRAALGNEHLQQMAQAAGLPIDKLLAMLSQQLPQTVDKMSPKRHAAGAGPKRGRGERQCGRRRSRRSGRARRHQALSS